MAKPLRLDVLVVLYNPIVGVVHRICPRATGQSLAEPLIVSIDLREIELT